MVAFLLSIAIACFFNVGGKPNTLERVTYTFVWLFAIIFVMLTIVIGWETIHHMLLTQPFSEVWRTLKYNLPWYWSHTIKRRIKCTARKMHADIKSVATPAGTVGHPDLEGVVHNHIG